MAYIVLFDEEKAIVQVTFSGSAVKEDHLSAFGAALRLCQEHTCSKLLVDFKGLSKSSLSAMESFEIGETIAKDPTFSLLIAHVLPTPIKACEIHPFRFKCRGQSRQDSQGL